MDKRPCLLAIGAVAGLLSLSTAHAQGLRPAVGNPLAKAKSLMGAHNYAAATAQVNLADRVKGKTPDENFVIQQMRGAIAQQAGDTTTASRIFGELINSGRLSGAQLTNMLLAETSLAYQNKDYPGVITWAQKYTKAGGKDPAVRTLVIQAYYLQKDWVNAASAQKAEIDQIVAARKVPPEDKLQLLAACQKALPGAPGLKQTMQTLVTYYPKQSYWADLIYALQTEPGFSDRLELDLDRFRLRVGALTTEADYMQMAQLALGDNDPGGALSVIAVANTAHVFGGAQAAREQRLTALANTTANQTKAKLAQTEQDLRGSNATTADQLFVAGQNYVSFKQYDKGIGIMKEALAKGGVRRPEIGQLRVAQALVDAGDRSAAIAAFQAVPPTTDGTSDLAQLWLLWLKTQPKLTPA